MPCGNLWSVPTRLGRIDREPEGAAPFDPEIVGLPGRFCASMTVECQTEGRDEFPERRGCANE